MSYDNILQNRVLVEIFELDRDAIFKQSMVSDTGKELFIVKDLHAPKGSDKFYSQSVNIGKIIGVSVDMQHIYQVDDIIVFDSLLDTDESIIFEQDEYSKKISIQASHTFHTTDYYLPPNVNGHGQWVWRKGDVDDVSKIFCIIRNGEYIVVNDFIFCESQVEKNKHTESGIYYRIHNDRNQVITRKVLAVHKNSILKPGDFAVVNQEIYFTLDISGRKFDCFSEDDIFLQIHS